MSASKERKFFLNSMNTWFSNFIIEEFRTDYLAEPKLRNEFMGTINSSSHPLPRLFEPQEIKIELGYNYEQKVFENDIFIFNLDDSNLQEVDFVIRGLKAKKFDNDKILILVTNIMTWGKTPQKMFTKEEIENNQNFNEEEFIPSTEIITEFDEIIPNSESNNKVNESGGIIEEEENKENQENNENLNEINNNIKDENNNQINNNNQLELNNNNLNANASINTSHNRGGQTLIPPNSNLANQQSAEIIEQTQVKNEKIFYYKDEDFMKRIPNRRYFQYKLLEAKALAITNPNVKVYVVCPGFIYGCGENFFYEYFRISWLCKQNYLAIVGDGLNQIPTIHILDLVQVIRRIIERKPPIKYIIAVDKTKNCCLKNIIKSISKCLGTGNIKCFKEFNIDELEVPNYIELSVDIKMRASKIFFDEKKEGEDMEDFNKRKFNWHCEFGIPENIQMIRNEFNLYRNLNSVKIYIIGPPNSGKTKIAKKIADKLKLPYISLPNLVEWAKNLNPENNELGKETQEKLLEIEENVKKALEEYDKRKNKRKTDPPLEIAPFKKFSEEFIAKLIKNRIKSGEYLTRGYILDGFPKKYLDAMELFNNKIQIAKKIQEEPVEQQEIESTKIKKISKISAKDLKKKGKKEKEKEKIATESVPVQEPEIQYETKYEFIPDSLPNSVVFIDNTNEENLKLTLKNLPNYEENPTDIENRFNRRYNEYKNNNNFLYNPEDQQKSISEINNSKDIKDSSKDGKDEKQKKRNRKESSDAKDSLYQDKENTFQTECLKKNLKSFFEENKIEIFNFDYQNASLDFDAEFEKMYKYLERNGPINSYERLCDDDVEEQIIDTFSESSLIDNLLKKENNNKNDKSKMNEEDEEKEVMDSISGGTIKEESENNNNESNIKESSITRKSKSKVSSIRKIESQQTDINNNEQGKKDEVNRKDGDEKNDISNMKPSSKEISKKEEKTLSEDELRKILIQKKLEDIKDREKKLLEKKSEVLRRYLSENVVPLLAKGILHVCKTMPEDPVSALADFLIGTSFNIGNNNSNNINNKDNIVPEMMGELNESEIEMNQDEKININIDINYLQQNPIKNTDDEKENSKINILDKNISEDNNSDISQNPSQNHLNQDNTD